MSHHHQLLFLVEECLRLDFLDCFETMRPYLRSHPSLMMQLEDKKLLRKDNHLSVEISNNPQLLTTTVKKEPKYSTSPAL